MGHPYAESVLDMGKDKPEDEKERDYFHTGFIKTYRDVGVCVS